VSLCLPTKKAPTGAFLLVHRKSMAQVPGGIPVGCIQPNFQAINTHTNRTIDKPTRKAKAVAMLPLGGAWPSGDGALPRIMCNKAQTRLAKMAANATATNIFMSALSNDR
jgi:hypothetical protein